MAYAAREKSFALSRSGSCEAISSRLPRSGSKTSSRSSNWEPSLSMSGKRSLIPDISDSLMDQERRE